MYKLEPSNVYSGIIIDKTMYFVCNNELVINKNYLSFPKEAQVLFNYDIEWVRAPEAKIPTVSNHDVIVDLWQEISEAVNLFYEIVVPKQKLIMKVTDELYERGDYYTRVLLCEGVEYEIYEKSYQAFKEAASVTSNVYCCSLNLLLDNDNGYCYMVKEYGDLIGFIKLYNYDQYKLPIPGLEDKKIKEGVK
jgi:hypothetical protein